MKWPKRLTNGRSEAGETLVEVLFSSALMGLVVVAIVGGIATMVLGSAVHRDQSEANAVLVSAMEELKSTAVARSCPASPATLPAYPLPANVAIQKIEYQVAGTGGVPFTWSDVPSSCSLTSPLTLQRITLMYTHPDGTDVEPVIQFVKGDH